MLYEDEIVITYTLDPRNVVVDVGGDWEAFARANGGADLTREAVLGKPVEHFFQGAEVVQVYLALFEKVRREQRPLTINFRCDGPACRRRLRLSLSPLPEGFLSVETEVLEETSREAVPLLDKEAVRNEEHLSICCICSDVKDGDGRWVAIEKLSDDWRLMEQASIPKLSHGYCPRCLEEQLAIINASM